MATRDEGQASRLIQTDLGNIHVLDKLKMYMYTLNLESASYGKDLQHAWIVKSTFLKKIMQQPSTCVSRASTAFG